MIEIGPELAEVIKIIGGMIAVSVVLVKCFKHF